MNFFSSALKQVLVWEGGYSNNPKDPGGETKFGICKRDYPDLDIKNLTFETASGIYLEKYWNKCLCNLLPKPVALIVFDSAVNQGTDAATMLLQQALAVKVDGVIGDKTLSAANNRTVFNTVRDFTVLRIMRYISTKNYNIFGKGWINRATDTCMEAIRRCS